MPETPEETKRRELRELEGKNIAHYSVLLSAWIQTKMERDKALVTLSSAGIGLLVTLLTTVPVRQAFQIPLFVIAVAAFLCTILCSLRIYQMNSDHIERAIKGSSEKDPKLEKYDKLSVSGFAVGVLAALLFGLVSAIPQLH